MCRRVPSSEGEVRIPSSEVEEMKELIFEIGTEEMPAGFVPLALEELGSRFKAWLEEERIEYKDVKTMGTPRRLSLLALLAERQRPSETVKIGPPAKVAFDPEGRPTKAAFGFARQCGVDVSELILLETEKGTYAAVKLREEGKPTKELLRAFLPTLLTSLSLPKSMRWTGTNLRFIRPIRWILAVFGGEGLDIEVDGIRSSTLTYGHKFMAPAPMEIKGIEDYLEGLRKAYVLIDPEERLGRIKEGAKGEAAKVNGRPLLREGLLKEVCFMLEWPVPVLGRFRNEFLSLPREVLITAMEHHQRYFPIEGPKGELLPYFIAFSNTQAEDMEYIRKGNERVLEARLSDAKFFFEEDLKIPLDRRVEGLKGVLFQSQIGTLYEKVQRLMVLSERLTHKLFPEKLHKAKRAAYLSKADLLTGMVGEFPELQGIMGREYALKAGEDPEVAEAIFEQYLPRFSGDRLPQTETGIILSLADKIDTLVCCFSVGLTPTGTSDPFGLRRQALGLVMTVLGCSLRLSLQELISWAEELVVSDTKSNTKEEVLRFILGRFENLMLNWGYARDEIEAVLTVQSDDLLDAKNRIEALHESKNLDYMTDMVIAFKRVANILKGTNPSGIPSVELFRQEEEKALYEAYLAVKDKASALLSKEDYKGLITLFTSLRPYVDNFFDKVLVMEKDEKIKDNRLSLLSLIYELFLKVADFSKLNV